MSESRAPAPSFATLPHLSEPPATLLDYLAARFPHVGRDGWTARIVDGGVTFDGGEAATLATPYRPGERIRYFRAVEREPVVPFAEEVVYEDDDLLVVDKPPFLPVVPGGPYVNECLLYRIRRRPGCAEATAVHRLDRDTAGLVVFAKRRAVSGELGRLFMAGEVEKEYAAVARVDVRPAIQEPAIQEPAIQEPAIQELAIREWTVASRLVPGEPWFRMRTVPGAPNAVTRIALCAWRDGLGSFQLRPVTGKKHQLRVHLAELGFPIVGDRYYPELAPAAPPDFSRPLQLLAQRLRFRAPADGRQLDLHSRRRLRELTDGAGTFRAD